MQNVLPALLGATVFNHESYVLQAMQPTEDNIIFGVIKDRYRDIYQVIGDMAMLTASAQLRSSGRQGAGIADVLIAFGQSNTWQEQLLKYAMQYAKQVKRDYKLYMKGYEKGNYWVV